MVVFLEHADVGVVRKNLPVCVLDADPDRQHLSARLLEDAGFPVSSTASPAEALQKARLQQCRVVLVDSEMPEMNGFEFLESCLQCNRGMYVILITRFYSVDSAIKAIKRGAYDYLCKPVDVLRLTKALDELAELLSENPAGNAGSIGDRQPLRLDELRLVHIQRVLAMCNGNRLRAARLLGISRTSLYRFLKRIGR
jgi:two-component system response regulator RegA